MDERNILYVLPQSHYWNESDLRHAYLSADACACVCVCVCVCVSVRAGARACLCVSFVDL